MKNHLTTALFITSMVLSGCASVNTAHTPPEGSAERNAILQAVHHALARQGRKNLVLIVPYLGLLQQQTNKWKFLEWMPAEEGTDYKKYFANLKAKYPSAPPDIFPQ